MSYTFDLLPLRERGTVPIVPVFMPFAGCPFRCVFCAQDKQTGYGAETVDTALERLDETLKQRAALGHAACEVAFYGGTFTCLPPETQRVCLHLTTLWRQQGQVCRVRCSTRPDTVDISWLMQLKAWGLDRVELGVQSFADAPLAQSRRGYTGEACLQACEAVRASGLDLGIQLLPGMPGGLEDIFLQDVRTALRLSPACLRLYPCLVVEGTPLAELWRQGAYAPWALEDTVRVLGQGLALAWAAGVPVIRLSLAPEASLEQAVLAGPRHPALGNMIQAEALWQRLLPWLESLPRPLCLRLPHQYQGMFYGYQKQMAPRWQEIGVHRVEWKRLPKSAQVGEDTLAEAVLL